MIAQSIPRRLRLETRAAALALVVCCTVVAAAQAPPGVQPNSPTPKLGLLQDLNLFGGGIGGDSQHVTFAGSFTIEKGGRRGTLKLTATIDSEWHVYSLSQPPGGPQKSEIKAAASPSFKVLGSFQPDVLPHVKPPEVFPVNSEEHEGIVTWSAPIELAEGVEPEKLTMDMTFSGQVCKDGPGGTCIPLFGEKVAAQFAGFTDKSATPGAYHPDPNQAQLVLTGYVEPAAVAPGGKAKLLITAKANRGWHVYAYAAKDPDGVGANKPTLIYIPLPAGWKRSAVTSSVRPKTKPPLVAGLPEEKFHDEPVTWTIELTIPEGAAVGETMLTGYLGFQTCDAKSCLPPQAVQFRAAIPVKAKVEPGQIPLEFIAIGASGGAPAGGVTGYKDVAKLAARDGPAGEEKPPAALLPIIGLGLLGGLILNLMPCVLPVIGLKIMSFAQQGGQSRARIFTLNLTFFCGVMAVFLALAALATMVNLFWGEQFTYAWFKIALIIVTFAMALSFLGVWEIPMPGMVQSGDSSHGQHEGIRAAFLKGVFTTVIATPCSGPLLGPLFTYVSGSSPATAFALFGSIGAGMGAPYLIIGAFPHLVRWLPKPGPWMEVVKQVMGFVLLFTVVYFFASVPSHYVPTLATVIGVWFACWLIGRVPIYEDVRKQAWAWVAGVAAATLVGYASFAFFGPKSAEERQASIAWQPFSQGELSKLLGEGKTVMIDFTANWCLTCQYNTRVAIDTPHVKQLLEKNGVVPMLADWTEYNPAIKAKLEELNSRSIPLLAIYPAGKAEQVIILRDALLESQVLQALEDAGPSVGPTPQKHQMTSTKSQTNPND